jgi:hypothetical protein
MRIFRKVSIILILMMSPLLVAAEAEEKQGLQEVLPQFIFAWNTSQISDFLLLFHPDSRVKRLIRTDLKTENYIAMNYERLFYVFGEITGSEIRQYIKNKGRFAVQLTYKKKGTITGTFSVKKHKGEWLIDDFNPDGQLEPELSQ